MLYELFPRAVRQPPSKVKNLYRRQSMAIPPPLWHGQNALDTHMALVGNRGRISTLPSQVPRGRHGPPELYQIKRVPFPRTPGPEPEVLPSLHAVISANDDTPFKTLEVVKAIQLGVFLTE